MPDHLYDLDRIYLYIYSILPYKTSKLWITLDTYIYIAHKYDRNELFKLYIPSPCFYFEENGDFFLVHTHTHTRAYTLSLAFPLTLEISVPFRPTNCFFDRRPTFAPPLLPPRTKFQQTRRAIFPSTGLSISETANIFPGNYTGLVSRKRVALEGEGHVIGWEL